MDLVQSRLLRAVVSKETHGDGRVKMKIGNEGEYEPKDQQMIRL